MKSLFQHPFIFDVRSPKEYEHAHIPGAISLPLFTNEERAILGTIYKRKSKIEAIRKGVEFVGPKLTNLLVRFEEEQASSSVRASPLLYCARGGMRSGFFHAFLSSIGFEVDVLEGGYKAFRKKVLTLLEEPYQLALIGGFTGSGKTELLHILKNINQVIDLEALASHRGSVYGNIPQKEQPSCEHFENLLGIDLAQKNPLEVVWVEDESRLIGKCCIPDAFYKAMKQAPLYVIERPFVERLERIYALYAGLPKLFWIEATNKIVRRLGGAVTKQVLEYVDKERLKEAIGLLLEYYDKAYTFSLTKHQGPIYYLDTKQDSLDQVAKALMTTSCANSFLPR